MHVLITERDSYFQKNITDQILFIYACSKKTLQHSCLWQFVNCNKDKSIEKWSIQLLQYFKSVLFVTTANDLSEFSGLIIFQSKNSPAKRIAL